MSACDVSLKSNFTVRRTNGLEDIAQKVEDLVTGVLDEAMGDLDGKIAQLEDAAREFGDSAERVLSGIGNPATLHDVASLLREGVAAMSVELTAQVKLANLAVDNEWESDAAERYAERAAAAAPTAGAGLVVSALGLVSFIGGLVVTAVSGFLLVKSIADLINGAEDSLQATVEDMVSQAIPEGAAWPILAQ
jgi:hypothetical protein